MMNFKRGGLALLIGAGAVLFLASLFWVQPNTRGVQAAVITPIAVTARGDSRLATYFDAQTITADTRVCFDLADYDLMDLQFKVDATDANTATVTFQQTNIDPTSGPFNTAQTVATVIATDADAFSQVGLFGRWNCAFVDLTNANPVTYTLIGVAK
jgi:hypothetical protein